MPTTVFDKSGTGPGLLGGTDDGDGNGNLNFRQIIQNAALGAATGTQMRVSLLFGTAETSETPAIDDLWGSQVAASGHPYDDNGNQVQFKFSGGNTINGSAAGLVASDWVTLGEPYDNTKDYVFAFHPTSGKSCNISFVSVGSGVANQWFDPTPGASNSATTVVTLSNNSGGGGLGLIAKIEIQAAVDATSLVGSSAPLFAPQLGPKYSEFKPQNAFPPVPPPFVDTGMGGQAELFAPLLGPQYSKIIPIVSYPPSPPPFVDLGMGGQAELFAPTLGPLYSKITPVLAYPPDPPPLVIGGQAELFAPLLGPRYRMFSPSIASPPAGVVFSVAPPYTSFLLMGVG